MNCSRRFRVGLLGAGKIAHSHARVLSMAPGVDLSAVCDLDAGRAESLARRWNIPLFFGNPARMLDEARLDVVHVLTPPPSHARAAVDCLRAGCDVLIEKPVAVSTSECDEIRAAARDAGRTAGVNHNTAFVPILARVVDTIRAGYLGRIEGVVETFSIPAPLSAAGLWMLREPGNIILETACHPLAQILCVLGKVRSASATAANRIVLAGGRPFYRTWMISLVCERGPAQLHFLFGGEYPDARLAVLGQDGSAVADLKRDTLHVSGNSRFLPAVDNLLDGGRKLREIAADTLAGFSGFALNALGIRPHTDSFTAAMRASLGDYYAALRGCRPPRTDLEFGAAVVEACEAIIRSSGVLECERREMVYA